MRNRSFWVLALAAVAVSSAGAVTRLDRSTRLYVKLAANQLATSLEDTGTGIRDTNEFSMRSGEATEIWIFDPNPLLFKYDAATRTEQTDDHTAALAFAKELAMFLARFTGDAGSGPPQDRLVEGLALTEFRDAIDSLIARVEGVPGWIDRSLDAKSAIDMKENVRKLELPKVADMVEKGFANAFAIWTRCQSAPRQLATSGGQPVSCDDPLDIHPILMRPRLYQRALDARAARHQAQHVAKRLEATLEEATADANKARAVLAEAESKKVAGLAEAESKKAVADIDAARRALAAAEMAASAANGDYQAAVNEAAQREDALAHAKIDLREIDRSLRMARAEAEAGRTIERFVHDVLLVEDRVVAIARTLRRFSEDVDALLVPRPLQALTYKLERQTVTVSVQQEIRYQSLLSSQARAARTAGLRKFDIVVTPHQAARLRPGVGFVVGFLRNPTFSTAKDGEAFRIVQTGDDLTRYNLAAMLNIIPRGWDEPTFGGFLQIGISPKKDETGFVFGGGISAQSIFTFGGGLLLQQVRQLGPGLAVGDTIAAPELLKTQTVFKPALYLHTTVTLPK